MTEHVVMINSGKADALDALLRVAPRADVDVITEKSYVAMYPAGTRLHLVEDIGRLDQVRETALRLHRQPISHVVGPSERSIQAAGYLRSFLGLPGIPYDVANRMTNKAVMKGALAARGIAVAEHLSAVSGPGIVAAAEALGWNVVVKPVLGTGSMNTFALSGEAEVRRFVASAQASTLTGASCPVLVEKFVAMQAEYHVDAVVSGGEVLSANVSRYLEPLLGHIADVSGSFTMPADDPRVSRLRALHQEVVTALGLGTGVTHLEAYETEAGFLVGEIACRPGGGGIVDAVEMQTGVDLWRSFMETELGLPLTPPRPDPPHADRLVVNLDLPIRPGRITRISSAQELSGLDDLIRVDVRASAGDRIGTRLHSSSATGFVFLAVTDPETAYLRAKELAVRFELSVE
ncbi:ATP-grasp domain-containing protein [Kineosporia sp. J2-2]|uniref:ATP-grasp domain-containing protein n=1 Tax=Kineosporia corallincola TaxID=2835133 RepID=A0ABS5TS25_9ACTN|nr:ATP-grasp domain-containing protein [Kineosporia corallincola]MBT0773593.1 ATP-grasp domain-containing protein [Kineosporia corallincola]